jgi:hypothetical protein
VAGRDGFQRLVADVGLGRAGLVMGLEVSRLARNSTDWHRLLEICALTDTLILDEDGLYGADGRVHLDPDQQVQGTLRLFFETFRRTGSAIATVKAFRHQRLKIPHRARSGPHRGEVLWGTWRGIGCSADGTADGSRHRSRAMITTVMGVTTTGGMTGANVRSHGTSDAQRAPRRRRCPRRRSDIPPSVLARTDKVLE